MTMTEQFEMQGGAFDEERGLPTTYFKHLECSRCKTTYSKDGIYNLCEKCQNPLLARYDLEKARGILRKEKFWRRHPNMWRYWEMLPIENKQNIITLQEGFTPIFKANNLGRKYGLKGLFIKDESLNPTASFKARGMSAAISKAKELGIRKVAVPSAGNAGSALAAYAAKAGMESYVFFPKDIPVVYLAECKNLGAHITLVNGVINDAGKAMREMQAQEGYFDCSTLHEPYRIEGKKTMGFELAEQFRWKLPDVIIYPTGGGTGLIGMWKAFEEMEKLGWVDNKRPRMVAVQASGCAPIVKAFLEGKEKAEPWPNPATIATGLRVPSPIGDFLMLDILRKSHGAAIMVSDAEILEAAKELGSMEGIFAATEGAAAFAAIKRLQEKRLINNYERILMFNTGSGLKYADFLK